MPETTTDLPQVGQLELTSHWYDYLLDSKKNDIDSLILRKRVEIILSAIKKIIDQETKKKLQKRLDSISLEENKKKSLKKLEEEAEVELQKQDDLAGKRTFLDEILNTQKQQLKQDPHTLARDKAAQITVYFLEKIIDPETKKQLKDRIDNIYSHPDKAAALAQLERLEAGLQKK